MPEKSLDIVIKGRNESRRAFQEAGKDIRDLAADFVKVAVGGAAISTAAKAAAAGVMGIVAARKEAKAAYENDAAAMLESQIKINDAWAELGRAVPVIGESIGKAMAAWQDNDGIRKTIQLIQEAKRETEAHFNTTMNLMRETALLEAKLRGEPPSGILGIQTGFKREDQEKILADMRETERKALEALKGPQRELENAEVLVSRYKRSLEEHPDAATDVYGMKTAQADRDTAKALFQSVKADYDKAVQARKDYEALLARSVKATETEIAQSRAKETADAKAQAEKEFEARAEAALRADREAIESRRRLQQERERALQEEANAILRWEAYTRQAEERRFRESIAADREKMRKEEEMLTQRAQLEDTIFAATHSAEEVRRRDIENRYAKMAEQYKSIGFHIADAKDKEMLGLIDAARQAELAGIKRPGSTSTDVAAFSARFLTHAPGRTADPEWAKALQSKADQQVALMKEIVDKLRNVTTGHNWG